MRPILPFLTFLLASLPALAAQPKQAFDVSEAGVSELQARMRDGKLDSQALTRAYLQRIARIDRAGPRLNSIIELNPDALKEAAALDRERRAGHVRGPLHGIPILLKDNIDAVGMANSAGSLALADNRPSTDAPLVAKLRAAGAVILGKTNLSEWANFRSAHASSGWSGRGGQTRNPYVLDRNPCGSSAGTGSAIAASLATVGIGTETDGSILCPASMAGLVGIKPTLGLMSRTGIIPIAHSQDTAGPMARSVADAAALLGAMAGSDPRDAATKEADAHRHDYVAGLHADGLKGKRIGVVRKLAGMEPNADHALEAAIATLRAQGAIVIDPVDVANLDTLGEAEMTIMLYEFKHDLTAYLRDSNAKPKTLAALIDWNNAHAKQEMPWFGQDLFEKANAAGGLDDRKYLDALAKAKRLSGPEGIDAALVKHHLDALIAPSWGPAFPTDPVLGDHIVSGDPTIGGVSQLPAMAGYPSVTVPAGFTHGLPVGVMFLGTAWSEPVLLDIAYGYEQATHARKAPTFIPTIVP
ncbi:amidase [Solilutibacter silvestris]|uniref:Asp-tRNAAsn/Glu-tRNAGln amidotransferase A subunit n=1 Tax=Solilutibacter silvestris TaxID=1645665 RepID=A0A2K1PY49_9GAMM|nr:amidase [Lysobacter silvestris]PNS07607.1 Asp-tRNAAsn/Glu-tRNAGln amidotransferase A subunit [Lysobacter silvestris]